MTRFIVTWLPAFMLTSMLAAGGASAQSNHPDGSADRGFPNRTAPPAVSGPPHELHVVQQAGPSATAEPDAVEAISPAGMDESDPSSSVYCSESCRQAPWHWRMKRKLQASHWGYPEYFYETPFGLSVRSHFNTQIASGFAARMVLYAYDFYEGKNGEVGLTSRGRRQLLKIGDMAQVAPYPIVIAATYDNPALDEARRHRVLAELSRHFGDVPESLVIVGGPPNLGLLGIEAVAIDQNLYQMTRQGGGAAPSSATSQGVEVFGAERPVGEGAGAGARIR